MFFSFALNIDENIIKVYNNKNIELFYQDHVDIAPESDKYINQSKKHYLVLEIAITSFKNYLLFITFSDPHLKISIS